MMRFLKGDSLLAMFLGGGALAASGRVFNFGTMLILTSALGSAGFGVYALTLAWTSILMYGASLGIPEFVMRELAVDETSRQHGLSRKLRRYLYLVQAISLLGTMALFSLAIVTGFTEYLNSLGSFYLWWIVLFLPFQVMMTLNAAILRGFEKVKASVLVSQFIPPLLLFVSLAVAQVTEAKFALCFYMATYVGGILVALILVGRLPKSDQPITDNWPRRPWAVMRGSLPFMWLGFAYFLNQRADILMLDKLGTISDVGVYQVAAQFGLLIIFPLQLMNSFSAPRMSKAFRDGDKKPIEEMLVTISAITFTAGLLGTIAILTAMELFIGRMLGPEFSAVPLVFTILALGNLIYVFVGPVGMFLTMARFEKIALHAMIWSAASNITFNLILIPLYGIIGAATGTTLSLVVWNVIVMIQAKRHLGLPTSFSLFLRKFMELVRPDKA